MERCTNFSSSGFGGRPNLLRFGWFMPASIRDSFMNFRDTVYDMNIKPIETRYAGYRFRSRLEARWAVYFDALRWSWEYEAEGYVLSNGQTYLPDFQFGPNFWAEVKAESALDTEFDKARQLVKDTGGVVLLLAGLPAESSVVIVDAEVEQLGYVVPGDSKYYPIYYDWYPVPGRSWPENCHIRTAAAQAARSARFEHGEKPFRTPSG